MPDWSGRIHREIQKLARVSELLHTIDFVG
jgi:hypothetical protein